MEKLNKLQINSEKLMNNEELITLRGGYNVVSCYPEDPGQSHVSVMGFLQVANILHNNVLIGVHINLNEPCLN